MILSENSRGRFALSQVSAKEETTAGNYFVSNYPPYSFWNSEHTRQGKRGCRPPPRPDAPLGIYVHIPFCRKRCHFCYFKVYTDKDSAEIDRYLDAVDPRTHAVLRQTVHRRAESRASFISAAERLRYLSTGQLSRTRGRDEAAASLGPGRGNRLRVRAGHHHRGQARDPQGDGRNPSQPRHRKLRRRYPPNATVVLTAQGRSTAPTSSRARSAFRKSISI